MICDTIECQETMLLRTFCVKTVLSTHISRCEQETACFSDNVDFTFSKLDFVPTETPKITELKITSRGLKVHT